jgi:hypothetical protein
MVEKEAEENWGKTKPLPLMTPITLIYTDQEIGDRA